MSSIVKKLNYELETGKNMQKTEHTEEYINSIETLYINTTMTNAEIAETLGKTESYIRNIITTYNMTYNYQLKHGFSRTFMTYVKRGEALKDFPTREEALKFMFSASKEQLSRRRGKHYMTRLARIDTSKTPRMSANTIQNVNNISNMYGFNFHSPRMQEAFRNMYKEPVRTMEIINSFLIQQEKVDSV